METVLATTRRLSLLSQMNPVQALAYYFFKIPQSTPASSKYALPWKVYPPTPCIYIILAPVGATCPTHWITWIIFGEEHNPWSSSLCNFL